MARPVVPMSWVEVGSQARYVGEKPSAEHAETGAHYVSVLSGKRLCLALGPFDCHSIALGHVDRVKSHVRAHYRDSWTYGFGTCRVSEHEDAPPGKLNVALGLGAPEVR